MALQKSNIPVVFSGGVDQKTAKQLVVPGSFAALENCTRLKSGAIDKRFGYFTSARSTQDLGSAVLLSTLQYGDYLATRGEELLQLGSTSAVGVSARSLFTYSENLDKWILRGPSLTVPLLFDPIDRSTTSSSEPDIAFDGAAYTVVVYATAAAGANVVVAVYDFNMTLVHKESIGSAGTFPRVAYVGANTFIIGHNTAGATGLESYYLSTSTMAVTPITNISASAGPWDMVSYSLGIVIFAARDGANIRSGRISILGTTNSTFAVAPLAGTPLAITKSLGTDYWVAFQSGAGASRILRISTTLVQLSNTSMGVLATARNFSTLAITGDSVAVFLEFDGATADQNLVMKAVVNAAGAVTTAATTFRRSVGLASKAFNYSSSDPFIFVAHESPFQSCYFLCDYNGAILARTNPGFGTGLSMTPAGANTAGIPSVIPRADALTGAVYLSTVLGMATRAETATGTAATDNRGIRRVDADFSGPFSTLKGVKTHGITINNCHLLSGGTIAQYDGANYNGGPLLGGCATPELGFHLFPERIGSVTTPAGGTLAAGSYVFKIVYEFIDNQGQVHQSLPSLLSAPVAVALNDYISIFVPTLRMSDKWKTVYIVAYVSDETANETLLYRSGSVVNNNTNDIVELVVTAVSPASPIIYTSGGLVGNQAPPGALCIHQHRGRLFAASAEDGNVYFSKRIIPGEGISFGLDFFVEMDQNRGPVRAMATLDDKLILFKKDRIYVLVGDGPLDTGQQDDFQDPQLIAADVGTSSMRSLAVTSAGIYFQSDKGLYVLTRDLVAKYVGAPLEDSLNGVFLTSAVVLPEHNEIRWTQAPTGKAFVYNYYFNQWSTFESYAAASGCIWQDQYVRLATNGAALIETASIWSDNGAAIAMAIETGWLAFAGLAGFQRIYQFTLMGEIIDGSSPPTIYAKLAYDYENSYTETIDFVPTGVTGDYIHYEIAPARQKCDAIKVRLEQTEGATGGYRFVNMSALIGRKIGQNKFPLTRQAGGRT